MIYQVNPTIMVQICEVKIMDCDKKKFLKLIQELFFIPCAAHSLNLVANDAAKLTYETINFFTLIQEL